MADKITTTKTLAIGFQWTDTDLKEKITYIKVPNPKPNITKTNIDDAFNSLAGQGSYTNAILLDKNGQKFDRWTDAYTETTIETVFDIGVEN